MTSVSLLFVICAPDWLSSVYCRPYSAKCRLPISQRRSDKIFVKYIDAVTAALLTMSRGVISRCCAQLIAVTLVLSVLENTRVVCDVRCLDNKGNPVDWLVKACLGVE